MCWQRGASQRRRIPARSDPRRRRPLPPLLTGAQTNTDERVALALGRAIQSPDSLTRHASPFRWLASLLEQAWTESLHRRQH